MIELVEKAANYAAGKANVAIDKAIAQAYADGYRDGYKDREEVIPVDLCDRKTEFVDLGLPSGTLWSTDYEVDGDNIKYLPYDDANTYDIPTKEQFRELLESCYWEFKYISSISRMYTCIGPNGNHIVFYSKGYKLAGVKRESEKIYFWVKSDSETTTKDAVFLYYHSGEIKKLTEMFSVNMLALRLVKSK